MKTTIFAILIYIFFYPLLFSKNAKTYVNSIGMEFIYIPAGSFLMGSADKTGYRNEHPEHRVKISNGFYIGKFEVTQEQWKTIMKNNPSKFKGVNLPVEQITYKNILNFINRLNIKEGVKKYDLPTEAEWEYACRAGSSGKFSFEKKNKSNNLNLFCWYLDNSKNKTHSVGQKRPNKWGLYDMHGNVWELCSDYFKQNYYSISPLEDPKGPSSGKFHIVRGGSYAFSPRHCRSAFRGIVTVDEKSSDSGFRLIMRID